MRIDPLLIGGVRTTNHKCDRKLTDRPNLGFWHKVEHLNPLVFFQNPPLPPLSSKNYQLSASPLLKMQTRVHRRYSESTIGGHQQQLLLIINIISILLKHCKKCKLCVVSLSWIWDESQHRRDSPTRKFLQLCKWSIINKIIYCAVTRELKSNDRLSSVCDSCCCCLGNIPFILFCLNLVI